MRCTGVPSTRSPRCADGETNCADRVLPSGGLFQFSVQLGEALARAGAEVDVITGPKPELSSREPGCRVRGILPTWHPTAGADAPEWWRRARRGCGLYSTRWRGCCCWRNSCAPP